MNRSSFPATFAPSISNRLLIRQFGYKALGCLAAAVLVATQSSASLVPTIDFESADDVADNFRITHTGSGFNSGQTDPADAGEPNNDYLFFDDDGGAFTLFLGVYDTTPGDSSDAEPTFAAPFTVEFDLRVEASESSIGLFFFDPGAPNDALLGLFGADESGTTDRMRFFSGGDADSGSAGTNNGGDVNADSGFGTASGFTTLSFDYAISGTTPTITMSIGSMTQTSSYPGSVGAISNPAIALRLFDSNKSADAGVQLDNFAVIPEPGSLALGVGSLALLGVVLRRRLARA